MLTRPLVLYRVPRCGPDSDRNVYKRGRSGRICGRDSAERTIIVPKEWATNDIRVGLRPQVSMWYKISETSLQKSVIIKATITELHAYMYFIFFLIFKNIDFIFISLFESIYRRTND